MGPNPIIYHEADALLNPWSWDGPHRDTAALRLLNSTVLYRSLGSLSCCTWQRVHSIPECRMVLLLPGQYLPSGMCSIIVEILSAREYCQILLPFCSHFFLFVFFWNWNVLELKADQKVQLQFNYWVLFFALWTCHPKMSTSQVLCVGTKSAQRTQNQFELGNELMSAEIFNWILVHHHYQPEEGRGMSFLVSSTPLLNVRKSAIEEESAFVARSFDAGWGHITWLHLMSIIQLCCVYLCWCDLLAVVVVESSESKRC